MGGNTVRLLLLFVCVVLHEVGGGGFLHMSVLVFTDPFFPLFCVLIVQALTSHGEAMVNCILLITICFIATYVETHGKEQDPGTLMKQTRMKNLYFVNQVL